ncbi:MAG: class F sortase, partial [Chloroflexota bacterium]
LGYRPGQDGNAVIEGHLDSTSAPAVFWNLHALKPGDSVTVDRADGSVVQFAVTRLTSYSNDAAPLAAIFGAAATPRLNLITCSGAWDKATKEYGQRLVVSATEVATPVAASRPR